MNEKNQSFVELSISLFMLAASIFFEHVVGLTPCALCLVQRFIIVSLIIAGVITFRKTIAGKKCFFWYFLQIFLCIIGVLVAARHVWLQQNSHLFIGASCLPDVSIMLKMMPWTKVITELFSHGGAECSKIKWTFLGVTMPAWVALLYIILLTSLLVSVVRRLNPVKYKT